MSPPRILRVCLVAAVLLSLAGEAVAEPRRPGLWGRQTSRRLTAPMNSLTVVGGPLSTSTFGLRLGDQTFDAGARFVSPKNLGYGRTQEDFIYAIHAGIAFGLLDNLEVAAIFIPVEFGPREITAVQTPGGFTEKDERRFLSVEQVPIIFTYGLNFGAVDMGLRIAFMTGWPFTVSQGLPMVIRMGQTRLDTGVFFPLRINTCPTLAKLRQEDAQGEDLDDICQGPNSPEDPPDKATLMGVNLPVRFAWNVTPRVFLGLESGFAEPSLQHVSHDAAVPLGGFFGYTLPTGSTLTDITASFVWDNFVLVDPARDVDTVQPGNFRFTVGFNWAKMAL